jgi:hypothetical protein
MFQEKEGRSENGGHRYISKAAGCDDRMQAREIHRFFFRVHTERKNMSGSKGLKYEE